MTEDHINTFQDVDIFPSLEWCLNLEISLNWACMSLEKPYLL